MADPLPVRGRPLPTAVGTTLAPAVPKARRLHRTSRAFFWQIRTPRHEHRVCVGARCGRVPATPAAARRPASTSHTRWEWCVKCRTFWPWVPRPAVAEAVVGPPPPSIPPRHTGHRRVPQGEEGRGGAPRIPLGTPFGGAAVHPGGWWEASRGGPRRFPPAPPPLGRSVLGERAAGGPTEDHHERGGVPTGRPFAGARAA